MSENTLLLYSHIFTENTLLLYSHIFTVGLFILNSTIEMLKTFYAALRVCLLHVAGTTTVTGAGKGTVIGNTVTENARERAGTAIERAERDIVSVDDDRFNTRVSSLCTHVLTILSKSHISVCLSVVCKLTTVIYLYSSHTDFVAFKCCQESSLEKYCHLASFLLILLPYVHHQLHFVNAWFS